MTLTSSPGQSVDVPDSSAPARPWAGFILGCLGVTVLCLVTPYNDYEAKNTYLYGNHLPLGGLFLFTVLAVLYNPLMRRTAPRLVLSAADLLVFWAMVSCGAGLASSGLWRYLGPAVVAPAYFASYGAQWLPGLAGVPSWFLLTHDPKSDLATWFYHGLPHGQAVPWGPWIPVVIGWGIGFFFMASFSMAVCTLFRKQWIERERLSYPLAQVPLMIAADSGGAGKLIRSPLLWSAVVLVVAHHLLNTLHQFMPGIPEIAVAFDISGMQQIRPWNAIGLPLLEVYMAVIGVTFLLPADVAFTMWFTLFVFRAVRVIRVDMGYDPMMAGPLNQEAAISAGSFIALALWLIWSARQQLALIWQGFLKPSSVDQKNELMSYRTAITVGVIGLLGFIGWLKVIGIPWGSGVVLAALFGVILLVLARIIAEAGLLFVQVPWIPTDVMACWGTQSAHLPVANVTLLSEMILIHDPREHIMPAIGNAHFLPHGIRTLPRFFGGAIATAIALGFFISFLSFVWTSYHFGAVTMDPYGTDGSPHWSLDRALQYVQAPLPVNYGDIWAMLLGAALTGALAFMRMRFVWWPLAPIGLTMAGTYAMHHIAFSIFVGWLLKSSIVRAGGLNMYRKWLPFFLGLVIGEGIYGGAAALAGLIFGITTRPFLPT